jgi:3-deoxy-D-manno-octulosonate 8-phosphate phosphatase KdsC-like HAD superfamily phosphatase
MEILKEEYSSVFVIGDDETDLELFHRADYSAAPNNAGDVVKRAANFVSPDCGTNGVCQILEEILRFTNLDQGPSQSLRKNGEALSTATTANSLIRTLIRTTES